MFAAVGRYIYAGLVLPLRVQEIHARLEKLDGGVQELRADVVRVETIVDRCRHCSPAIILGDGP